MKGINKKHWIGCVAVIVAAVLSFPLIGGIIANEDNASMMARIETEQGCRRGSGVPEELQSLYDKFLRDYETNLTNFQHPSEELPQDLAEEIMAVAKSRIDESPHVIDGVEIKDGYDVLLRNDTAYFEAVVSGDEAIEIREVEVELLSSDCESEIVEEYKYATHKGEVATILSEKGAKSGILTLEASGKSYWWTICWYKLVGKNPWGWKLWELTAKGNFTYNGVFVIDVVDLSSAWAQGWLGWHVKDFDSEISWHPYLLWAQIDADAKFEGPFQTVHAWAWARVYGNGYCMCNGGTY